MDKTNKQRLRIILFLSVVTVLLFGGILVNMSIGNYINATAPTNAKTPLFLPSLSSERCYGTSKDDTYVDAFFVGEDTFVFYNADSGMMRKDGNESLDVTMEGNVLSVTLTPYGFAVALEKNSNISIKIIGFDGIPTASIPITLKNAELQYLDYDGNVCVAIKHQGDFDYVLSYFKYDSALNEVYRRDIYSLYNLSAIACYPLSNKTVIFFNAQYGSVKRGGYSVIYNASLAMETEYFSGVENYTVSDAKPYGNGFLITAISNGKVYAIELDGNMQQTVTELPYSNRSDAKIYTDSKTCYVGLCDGSSTDLLLYKSDKTVDNFADSVYDCIFIDGAAVFAIVKNGITYVNHINTGISSPIINAAPVSLKLKKNDKLTVFASLDAASALTRKGGIDVYCATLS